MLSYSYECSSCLSQFEVEQSIKDKPYTKCPVCETETLERVILEAPLFFIEREPTTVGQQAERNGKRMGRYGLEEARRKQAEDMKNSRDEARKELAKKLPNGWKLMEDRKGPKINPKLMENINNPEKVKRYIETGEI